MYVEKCNFYTYQKSNSSPSFFINDSLRVDAVLYELELVEKTQGLTLFETGAFLAPPMENIHKSILKWFFCFFTVILGA